jgi:hypothetical protein
MIFADSTFLLGTLIWKSETVWNREWDVCVEQSSDIKVWRGYTTFFMFCYWLIAPLSAFISVLIIIAIFRDLTIRHKKFGIKKMWSWQVIFDEMPQVAEEQRVVV